MGLFSPNFNRPGPGVPKDAPPKKGFARFFEILFRDYSTMFKANLLFVLCCIPLTLIITFGFIFREYLGMILIAAVLYLAASCLIGPMLVSVHAVVVKMVRDEPGYMWHDFKKAWKSNLKQSVPAGVMLCALLLVEVVALLFYMAQNMSFGFVMVGIVLFCILVVVTCGLLVFLQILFIDLPLGGMMKNALFMMFGFTKRTLPAGLVVCVLGALLILFFPLTLILILAGAPVMVAVIADMWAWPAMEQAFQISERQKARNAQDEDGQK